MKVTLRNKTWNLVVKQNIGCDTDGIVDAPTVRSKKIKLSRCLKNKSQRLMDVVIHECLHACFWDIDEEAINEASSDLAKVLHSLGARIDLDKKFK